MRNILKTVGAISFVASVAVSSASSAPLVGAFVAGAMMGGMATQNYMLNQPTNGYVYYENPQVIYDDTVIHTNGSVSRYMTTPPATVITTTTQKPVAYTQTTTVTPTVTYTEKTTYVQQQPTVTVVQPSPTVIYTQPTVVNTNPVVIYY